MRKAFITLLSILSLCACTNSASNPLVSNEFYFDTLVQVKLYDGTKEDIDNISSILKKVDGLSDNYENKINETSVYTLNHSNEEKAISNDLYQLLNTALELKTKTNGYFNPFIGSLSKKWKESLSNKQILSEMVINEELDKMNHTSLDLNTSSCTRLGEGEIDLGAMAKGYALDLVKEYLNNKNKKQYLIDGGSSSILLGSKNTNDGYFKVGLRGTNSYLNLKDCFVGASGTIEQGVTIDGVTYSHIVNPFTGSVINNYDATFVVGDNGALTDALSTSFMMMSVEEIKEMETQYSVSAIVYKDNKIVYKNDNLKLENH